MRYKVFAKKYKRKYKNGFTLIELLAVILILGIIALIAIPMVNKSIKTSKIKSGEVSVREFVNSFDSKRIELELQGEDEIQSGIYTYPDLVDLNVSTVNKFNNIVINVDNSGQITNGSFCIQGISYSFSDDQVMYQEYADFCNSGELISNKDIKLINGGFVLDKKGDLYAVGKHNDSFMFADGTSGVIEASSYKKVDTKGIKLKNFHYSWGSDIIIGSSFDDKLYAWGYGATNEDWAKESYPVLISDSLKVKEMYSGYYQSYVIDDNNQLWTWGYGCSGFGSGSIRIDEPRKLLDGVKIVSVIGINRFGLGVDENGDIWAWGTSYGAYLDGSDNLSCSYDYPTKVITGYNFKKLYSGTIYNSSDYIDVYAIDKDNNLWGWGSNSAHTIKENDEPYVKHPFKITDNVKKVSTHDRYFSVLKNDGVLYVGGNHRRYMEGTLYGLKKYAENVKDVSNSIGSASYYLDNNDRLYSFGKNFDGSLGIGIPTYLYTPTRLPIGIDYISSRIFLSNNKIYKYDIDMTYSHFKDADDYRLIVSNAWGDFLLKNNGKFEEIFCYDYYRNSCNYFLNSVSNINIVDVKRAFTTYTWLLKDINNNIYTFGYTDSVIFYNNFGYSVQPNKIYFNKILSNKDFNNAYISFYGGNLITKNNELISWGDNSYGQLGLGTKTNQTTPVKVRNDVIDFYDYSSFHLIIDSNNDLYFSGRDGYYGESQSYQKVNTDFKVKKIWNHYTISDMDDHVYAIGSNYQGTAGLGHNNNLSSFTKLLDGKKIKKVIYSGTVAYYITEKNELYVAGSSTFGNLGLGPTNLSENKYTKLMDDVEDVFDPSMPSGSGNNFIEILKTNGELYYLGHSNFTSNSNAYSKSNRISIYG